MESENKVNWSKYIIGSVLFLVGIGLLFIDSLKIVGYILIGLGIGKVI